MWESVFEELFVTARQDRYNIICSLNHYKAVNKASSDYISSGGGISITKVSINDALKFICVSLNFIETPLKNYKITMYEITRRNKIIRKNFSKKHH